MRDSCSAAVCIKYLQPSNEVIGSSNRLNFEFNEVAERETYFQLHQ
jgi:hypothetical protein